MVLWLLAPAAAAGLAVYYARNKNKIYEDVPLAAGARKIRVLKILPAAQLDDFLRCELHAVSLDNANSCAWSALSYAWGAELPTKTSTLNGKPVQFPRSLIKIIRQLRHSTEEKTFWIDAICINQNDHYEKDDQMRMMGEIYEKAEATYVYIGNETDTSRKIFKYLQDNRYVVLGGLDGDRIIMNYLEDPRIWSGIFQDIFPRRYWSRLWVVQEIIMSKNLIVKCGSQELPWDVFTAAWKIALRISVQKTAVTPAFSYFLDFDQVPNHWKADPNIDAPEALDALRNAYKPGTRPDLNFWLQCFKYKLCKDPRDKIFGLRGLAADRDLPELASLTNEQTAQSLFIAVTKFHLSMTGDLDVMLYRASDARMSDLPSWVPDYAQLGHVWQLTRDNFRAEEHYYAHGGIHQIPTFQSGECISLSGVYVDDVTHVDAFDFEERGPFNPRAKYNYTDTYPLSLNDYRTEFTRMITFDRDRQGRRFGRQQYLTALTLPRRLHTWEKQRLSGYSLILTERDYMGLSRSETKPGDMICVLPGCSVPVVLRRANHGKFTIVCGCYIQGIMDGEVLNGSGAREFQIV